MNTPRAPRTPLTSLTGLIPATVTPFTEDGALDEAGLRHYLEWLGGHDLGGVVVHADSGEVHALSPEERVRVTSVAADVLGGRIPVIAGLAAQTTDGAVAHGRALRDAGADAVMVFPPSAFLGTPLPAELPEAYYRAIAEGTGLPIVAFQLLAALGGVEYSPEALRRILDVEQVVALKEASFDAAKFRATAELVRGHRRTVSLLNGNDPFIHEALLLGADGCLVGFGSLAPAVQARQIRAVHARDHVLADELASALRPLAEAVFATPVRDYRARVKAALAGAGILRSAAVRAPLTAVPEQQAGALTELLRAAEDPVLQRTG